MSSKVQVHHEYGDLSNEGVLIRERSLVRVLRRVQREKLDTKSSVE
jgi:hypothetical protein